MRQAGDSVTVVAACVGVDRSLVNALSAESIASERFLYEGNDVIEAVRVVMMDQQSRVFSFYPRKISARCFSHAAGHEYIRSFVYVPHDLGYIEHVGVRNIVVSGHVIKQCDKQVFHILHVAVDAVL